MDLDITHDFARLALGLLFVLGLIYLLAAGLKKWGSGRDGKIGRGREKRLAVIEVSSIDPRRRLVLVRQDDREHLLLIGGGNDLVIDSSNAITSPKGERALNVSEGPEVPAVRREPTFGGGR